MLTIVNTIRLLVAASVASPALFWTCVPLWAAGVEVDASDAPSFHEELIEAKRVQEDLDSWLQWLDQTHPQLSYTTDTETLSNAAEELRRSLNEPMTRRAAWSRLATLNPIFDDAHTGLRLPQADFDAWKSAVGTSFPSELKVEFENGRLTVNGSNLEITAINGRPISDFVEWFNKRIRGESDVIRARIVSLKFPLAFWTFAGGAQGYQLSLKDSLGETTKQTAEELLKILDAPQTPPFDLSFEDNTATLRIDTFERGYEDEFAHFLDASFAKIKANNSRELVIDLRRNGGGAHDLSDRLMAYLTDQTYSPISAVTARIVPQNQAQVPGAKLGDVLTVPFRQEVSPVRERDNGFDGKVSILIGPKTYSQAIVFAATAKDIGVASLFGQPTEGRANQTGQVTRFSLPGTQFQAQSPLYILYRGAGDRSSAPLLPDAETIGR